MSEASEDIAPEMTEDRRFQLPHCRLMPMSRESLEYPHNPYIARN